MKIKVAHLRDQAIDFAVFDADAVSHSSYDRDALLVDLIDRAEAGGLKVDKGALAFSQNGRTRFHGTPDLVKYLAALGGVPRWTHEIDY